MSESSLMTSGTERLLILNALIPKVERIASQALDQRSRGLDVWKKSDGSIVTNVDIVVERALRTILAELDPHGSIFGEEEGWGGDSPSEMAWVIDPIDGTRMFAEERPGCSISVGFWSSEGAVAGVVHDLA
ncbi:MAG TPA: inositol monophosphatase family protein, partial [Candidatus Poseidoniales archaeon]|nr:inositol monophosphatase family protein [Candidatus Poseidoniales archaeon]